MAYCRQYFSLAVCARYLPVRFCDNLKSLLKYQSTERAVVQWCMTLDKDSYHLWVPGSNPGRRTSDRTGIRPICSTKSLCGSRSGVATPMGISRRVNNDLLEEGLSFISIFRGNSKYHYYGIRIKASSPLSRMQDDVSFTAMRHPGTHAKRLVKPKRSSLGEIAAVQGNAMAAVSNASWSLMSTEQKRAIRRRKWTLRKVRIRRDRT